MYADWPAQLAKPQGPQTTHAEGLHACHCLLDMICSYELPLHSMFAKYNDMLILLLNEGGAQPEHAWIFL
jgi:hypothetical protein